MLGAVAGDIIGSPYEWNNTNDRYFELCRGTRGWFRGHEVTYHPKFTDDTVMTLAVAEALMDFREDGVDLPGKLACAMKHYGKLAGGKETGMGTTKPAEVPENDSMDAMAEKYEKQIEKLQEQLNAEIERIGELGIECEELDKAIDAVNTY